MRIEIYPPLSIHEIGQRDNQEDAISQWDNRLFVLCDGMGGHEHGEVASQTVCQSIVTWFKEHVSPDAPFTDDQLRAAIEYAYQQLDQYADGSPKQMGTTLTLLYIGRNGITAAHMGDSRIYHLRPQKSFPSGSLGGVLLYQSRDHSLAFDLFQSGEITYEEMLNYPQKNIVTRAMTPGGDNRMRPDIIHITDVQTGDYFYMCSDGMLEQMSNEQLVKILSSNLSDEDIHNIFVESTYRNQDNHSAWIIHLKDIVKEEGDEVLPNEELTARCNMALIIPFEENNDDDVVIVKTERKSLYQRVTNFIRKLFMKRFFYTLLFSIMSETLMAQAAGGTITRPLKSHPIPEKKIKTTDQNSNKDRNISTSIGHEHFYVNKDDEFKKKNKSEVVNVKNVGVETNAYKIELTTIILTPQKTILRKYITLKRPNFTICSTKDEYIEDVSTGTKYYIKKSDIGFEQKKMSEKTTQYFNEEYPPLPYCTQYVTIASRHSSFVRNFSVR